MTSKADLDEALERYHRTALRVRDEAKTEGAREERARIRKELLAEFGEPGPIEWRHLMTVLDRICPEAAP